MHTKHLSSPNTIIKYYFSIFTYIYINIHNKMKTLYRKRNKRVIIIITFLAAHILGVIIRFYDVAHWHIHVHLIIIYVIWIYIDIDFLKNPTSRDISFLLFLLSCKTIQAERKTIFSHRVCWFFNWFSSVEENMLLYVNMILKKNKIKK